MNKKILIPAIMCVALQLVMIVMYYYKLFEPGLRVNIFSISSTVHLIAIPYVFYQLFTVKNNVRPYRNIYNVIAAIFTLPVLFGLYIITLLILYGPSSNQTQDIDPEDIHIYDQQGNEIPKDSLLQRIKKDSAVIEQMSVEKKNSIE